MAQPSRTRYFKGKAPELAESDSDEEEDEEVQPIKPKFKELPKVDRNVVAGGAGRIIPEGGFSGASMKPKIGDLKNAKIDGGRVLKEEDLESEEESEEEEPVKPKFVPPKPPAGDEVGVEALV